MKVIYAKDRGIEKMKKASSEVSLTILIIAAFLDCRAKWWKISRAFVLGHWASEPASRGNPAALSVLQIYLELDSQKRSRRPDESRTQHAQPSAMRSRGSFDSTVWKPASYAGERRSVFCNPAKVESPHQPTSLSSTKSSQVTLRIILLPPLLGGPTDSPLLDIGSGAGFPGWP